MDLFDDLPEPVNKELQVDKPNGLGTTKGTKRNSKDSCGSIDCYDNDTELDTSTKRSCIHGAILKGYVVERKGEREDMQDAHIILDQFHQDINSPLLDSAPTSFYGIFDGHGGARASTFAAKHLALNVASRFPKGSLAQVEKDIRKCFIDAFKKTDEDFLKEATKQKPSWKDGTTALTILVLKNTLYIANLGDSKAVLCRHSRESGRATVVPLSRDHNPTLYEERMRIQKMGGFVRDGRVMGILEVSRSIGDGQYKTLGVTCLPDIKRCQLAEDDRFIIMACDGLWKVFSSEEAVEFVTAFLEAQAKRTSSIGCSDASVYQAACVRLAHEAILKGSGDNVTVLILSIQQKPIGQVSLTI